jgi:DNA mismatch repair ATPase MutS
MICAPLGKRDVVHFFNNGTRYSKSFLSTRTQNISQLPTQPPQIKMTPALVQHSHFKKEYPNHLILFQVGDFFEMFHEDAVKCSELLDLALMSKRNNNGLNQCGFPVDKLESKLELLIKKGAIVAVCEQVGGDSSINSDLKKREITRLGKQDYYDII